MRKLWQRFSCRFLSGHEFTALGNPSPYSQHIRCTRCGREYGVNHDVRSMLPWHLVAGFYAERGYRSSKGMNVG